MARPTAKHGRKPIRATKGRSNPVDEYVGSRIRQRRMLLGLSQDSLGKAVGLTFQQIQKYERGINRVGASRLYTLSAVLDVPIEYFYDGIPRNIANAGSKAHGFAESTVTFEPDVTETRETTNLVKAYYQIKDETQRKRVMDLIKAMGD